MAVPLVMIISFGLYSVLTWIQSRKSAPMYYILYTIFYLVSFTYFIDAYFIHVPNHNSQYWNYGYKQVVEKITPIQSNYKNIIVEQSYAQPYIYFLFFQKYDPVKYQKQAELTKTANTSDVGLVGKLDNIQFVQMDWSQTRNTHGALVIVNGTTPIPNDMKYTEISKVDYLNGRDSAFEIIQIQ